VCEALDEELWLCTEHQLWCCVDGLAEHITIPPARWYWLEAQTYQWPDGSGTQMYLQIDQDNVLYACKSLAYVVRLPKPLMPLCTQLDVKRGGPMVRIYFRLLYEE